MSDIQGQIVLAENSAGNGLQRLKLNSAGLLRVVAEATSVSANQIDLNTDGLEGLIASTNTTLASILVDTDAADSSLNTIEANSSLTASRLNNIQNKISANTDGTGDTLGQMVASTNTALATIDGVLDNAEAHLGNIDTGVDVLEACVGSNKVNVNISSGNITGFATATNQSTIIGHIDGVESSLTAITGYVDGIEGKQDTMIGHMDGVEGLLTTIDADTDAIKTSTAAMVVDLAAIEVINNNAEVHLGNIDTGVDVLEACVGSNKVNVNISSGNISGFSTASNQSTIIGHLDGVEGKLDTLETTLTAIETDIAANEVLHTAANALLTTIDSDTDAIKTSTSACATDLAAIEVLHTATNQKLDDIETAVQLIDDAIKTEDLAHSSGDKGIPCLMVRQDSHSDLAADGDYMIPTINANGEIRVTSTAASGGATESKQDAMITDLAAIEVLLTQANSNQGTLDTSISETTDAIDTMDAVLDQCLVKQSAMVVDLAALEVLQTTTNSKIDTFDAVLDASLVKQTAMTTDLAALEVLQTTIKNDAMVETIIFNAQINATATGTSSAFERPRNATNWAILIENTSANNGNHEINISRSVNNSIYFTSSTDYNTIGERNNVIEFTPTETLGSQKYFKIVINNQDSSNHTYKVTVCA